MMTDPIADMLTRVRNANRIESPAVDMPSTQMKQHLAQVLSDGDYCTVPGIQLFTANACVVAAARAAGLLVVR